MDVSGKVHEIFVFTYHLCFKAPLEWVANQTIFFVEVHSVGGVKTLDELTCRLRAVLSY